MAQGLGALFLFNEQRGAQACRETHAHCRLTCFPPVCDNQVFFQNSHLLLRQTQPETQNRHQWYPQRFFFSLCEMHDFPMFSFLRISITFPGKWIKNTFQLSSTREGILFDDVCELHLHSHYVIWSSYKPHLISRSPLIVPIVQIREEVNYLARLSSPCGHVVEPGLKFQILWL